MTYLIRRILWCALISIVIAGCASAPTTSAGTATRANAAVAPATQDEAAIALPTGFHTGSNASASAGPSDWVEVSSLSMDSPPAELRARYDKSAFQAFDPWLGISTTPIFSQTVFVRERDASRVKADPNSWPERYVVQIMKFPGQIHLGSRAFAFWTMEDADRLMCHEGLQRKLLRATLSEMVYESKFANCPKKFRLGPDRVVLTRELALQTPWSAGSSPVLIFSYEVKGGEMRAAQRTEGMNLINAPHTPAPGEQGLKFTFSPVKPATGGEMH